MRLIITILLLSLLAGSCKPPQEPISDHDLVNELVKITLHVTKTTPANSPTFASRAFGYIGLTMYEAVCHADSSYSSLADQLDSLDQLPIPDQNAGFNWRQSLVSAHAEILQNIYIQTSDANKAMISDLEEKLSARVGQDIDRATNERSKAFGIKVANAIFEWSKTDGGHRGYLKNFDKTLTNPTFPGAWSPPLFAQSFSHFPLHPHWGDNRTFLPANEALAKPVMIPYDTLPTSAYYQQMKAVYDTNLKLTDADKQTAIWWSDDPDSTYTPPGHSIFLARNVIVDQKVDLVKACQTMAALGIGLCDAYIKCWHWKYKYFSERPNAYITKYIDHTWESFWPDPPFPAFPSGHAIQGSTAATILTSLYGGNYTFFDNTHVGRYRDEVRDTDFVGRDLASFEDMARQCANSRLLGGIHTPQDNETGLAQGKLIGQNVMNLKWRK